MKIGNVAILFNNLANIQNNYILHKCLALASLHTTGRMMSWNYEIFKYGIKPHSCYSTPAECKNIYRSWNKLRSHLEINGNSFYILSLLLFSFFFFFSPVCVYFNRASWNKNTTVYPSSALYVPVWVTDHCFTLQRWCHCAGKSREHALLLLDIVDQGKHAAHIRFTSLLLSVACSESEQPTK